MPKNVGNIFGPVGSAKTSRNPLCTIAGIYPDIARHTEQGKPESLPLGKLSVKIADSGAGKGGWRKPMLHYNDADTDLVFGTKVNPFLAGLPLQEN